MCGPRVRSIVNIVMLVAFVLVFTTGLIKFPGLLRSLGMDYRLIAPQVSPIHDWAGLSLGILIIIHIIIHWKWWASLVKRKK